MVYKPIAELAGFVGYLLQGLGFRAIVEVGVSGFIGFGVLGYCGGWSF